MSEPNQNENPNVDEQQVFDNSVLDTPQKAAAETVENSAAPQAGAAESVPMQDFVNQAAAPVQGAYGQQAYDTYGQPANQTYDPNAQYGYAAPAPSYAPAPSVGAPKSKVAAGVLGILLGGLGIHKFYLGYTVPGIIMLLISVLTLGMLAVVPAVIGLVEGIIYLTMDDTQFYNTYVVGKKEWF